MCVATPGGDGKFTNLRSLASISGFTGGAPTVIPDQNPSIDS
jgi:hypothetical protein